MDDARRPLDQLRVLAWLVLVPLIAVFTLPFLLLEIGPAYEARFGGAPGTFTAEREDCADDGGACRWSGSFQPEGPGRPLAEVRLLGGGVDAQGQTVSAVDIGRDGVVYPEGGGSNWLLVTALLAGVTLMLALWSRSVLRRWRSRERPGEGGSAAA